MKEWMNKSFNWMALTIIVLTLLGIAGRMERIEKQTAAIQTIIEEAQNGSNL